MTGLALLIVLASGPTAAAGALEAAVACYEGLDYACAEERLAEALAGGLEGEALARARLYQALVALAYRDEPRARTAIRALLALEPDYEPDPLAPPRLRALVEAERPPPPPALLPIARVDATNIRLFGQDSDRWSEGLGVEAAGGVLLDGHLALEVAAGYSDHRPRTFTLEGLDLLTLTAGAAWRGPAGDFRLSAGLAAGAARVSVRGVTGDDRYWGALIEAPLELVWPAWAGFGLGLRVAPAAFVVEDDGRAAISWLLPLMAGIRYAP